MGDRIHSDGRIERGQAIVSNNRRFKLYVRNDGRVKLYCYEPNRRRELGRISGYAVGDEGYLWLSPRGYLFGGKHDRISPHLFRGWARPRNGNGPDYGDCFFVMQDDGNAVIYTAGGAVVWSTATNGSYRLACDPELVTVSMQAGQLAISADGNANGVFVNPTRDPINITDGVNTVQLDRNNPQGIFHPSGPGQIAIRPFKMNWNDDAGDSSGDSDAHGILGYVPDSIATRDGNTFTVKPRGSWLVDPTESARPVVEPMVEPNEQLDWVDYGFTDEDAARLEGTRDPIEIEPT